MERTWRLTAVGIWIVISGCIAIGGGARLFTTEALNPPIGYWDEFAMTYGFIGIIVGVTALFGGIFALKRRWWGIALLGAILSLLAVFYAPFLIESRAVVILFIILGILSIIFVSKSKEGFS